MIPKPYEWKGVLTNTRPIALIETTCKILFKILSDRISSACSTYDVFRGDNFLVLKGTMTQSLNFAVGLVVEDALEKNRELWLVLQDMRKMYDSVDWEHLEKCLVRIKMCDKFIRFFGGIHKSRTNRVMTDFVKRQESVCEYRLISHFVSKSGHVKSQAGLSSYFAVGVFVDDTIWVGSSQRATQHILDVASEFFRINDISINNDKTVAIPINCKIGNPALFISSSPIFVAKKGESHYETPMSTVLGESVFSRCLLLLWRYGVAFVDQLCDHYGTVFDWSTFKQWKKLDLHGPIPEWFRLSAVFLAVNARVLSVYTDGSLRNLGTVGYEAGAAAFFEDIGVDLGVGMSGLMSSTMAELQTIALALECIPVFSVVHLFSDSQSALDACKSELGLVVPDFRNWCWVECQHIANVIYSKGLRVNWHKVKGHSGISGNEHADVIAGAVSVSDWFLPPRLDKHFLMADGNIVFGNSRHFIHDTFYAMCRAHWEVGSGSKFLPVDLCADVNWSHSSLVWHPDLHMATGFTSNISANVHSYFMKTLHYQLPVAVRKWLYNRLYPSVLCLYCGDVEVSDHVFSCKVDDSAWHRLLDSHMNSWETLSGSSVSSSVLLQLLLSCVLGSSVSMALYKGFVFDKWFGKAVSVFHNPKVACLEVVNFARSLGLAFRDEIWLVQAKHCAYMEKHGLIPLDGSSPISVSGLISQLSAGVVDLLGIDKAFGVYFGFRKSYMFFSGIGDSASVYIAV
ncbi:hypothetical protein G9A89_017061 [Geosiphon pyriformis]|nr:hypothetical protein G9A89_017061 [Geosiphon pyriformis]